MKIISIRIENFKNIQTAELEFSEDVNIVSGKNRAGKTSLLDAICLTLGGAKAEELLKVPEPIKNGEDFAEVEITTNEDYVIAKKWFRGKSPVLSIKSKKGAKYPSPQALVNEFLGLFIDPSIYVHMKDKEFTDIVATQAGILDKLISNKMLYDVKYQERTNINRDLKKTRAMIDGMSEPEINLPDVPLSLSDLQSRLEEANSHSQEIQKKEFEIQKVKSEFQEIKNSIPRYDAEIDALLKEIENKNKAKAEALDKLKEVAELGKKLEKDVSTLKLGAIKVEDVIAEMNSLEEINHKINYKNNYYKLDNDASDLFVEVESLTGELEEIKADRSQIIATSKLPIEGLGFNEDDLVTYNGVVFSQLSEEEKASVSAAISIQSKSEEKLEVLILRNAGGFTQESLDAYIKTAKENGYQLIIERPGALEFGIVVENGKIIKGAKSNG